MYAYLFICNFFRKRQYSFLVKTGIYYFPVRKKKNLDRSQLRENSLRALILPKKKKKNSYESHHKYLGYRKNRKKKTPKKIYVVLGRRLKKTVVLFTDRSSVHWYLNLKIMTKKRIWLLKNVPSAHF